MHFWLMRFYVQRSHTGVSKGFRPSLVVAAHGIDGANDGCMVFFYMYCDFFPCARIWMRYIRQQIIDDRSISTLMLLRYETWFLKFGNLSLATVNRPPLAARIL